MIWMPVSHLKVLDSQPASMPSRWCDPPSTIAWGRLLMVPPHGQLVFLDILAAVNTPVTALARPMSMVIDGGSTIGHVMARRAGRPALLSAFVVPSKQQPQTL